MASVPRKRPADDAVAILVRVSSEEQALRETIKAQLDYLVRHCELNGVRVAGVYADDGVSGTVPLGDRPEGRRLLDDAAAGAFSAVLVYRLDRLARRLAVLLDAFERLDALGVAIKSATEGFDTSTPFGRAVFQFLGVVAELEKETLKERTTGGRDRVARDGRYTGGPVPWGLEVDADGYYVPADDRWVAQLGCSEPDAVRGIFRRLAYEGSTLLGERIALSALGVPCRKRYPPARSGRSKARPRTEPETVCTDWALSTLAKLVHNPIYYGTGTLKSANGEQARPVPALVDRATWEAAQRALTKNRRLSKRNARRDYLLRGLVRCGECGLSYGGAAKSDTYTVYRCIGDNPASPRPGPRCHAGAISCRTLDDAVWAEVRRLADDPVAYLEEAQLQQRARAREAADEDAERRACAAELAGLEPQRQRVLGMYRKGHIPEDSCERQLDEIACEERALRERLDQYRLRAEMASAGEAYLAEVASALADLVREVEQIEAEDDRAGKRRLIETLVVGVTLRTELLGVAKVRMRKRVTAEVRLALGHVHAWATDDATATPSGDKYPLPDLTVALPLAG